MSVTRPASLIKTGALMPATRFRLGVRTYALTACVCLYRHEISGGPAEFLLLTPDMRFAHVARAPGEIDIRAYAAIEHTPAEARDFLIAHGEGDMVDDFPDLFSIVERASRLVDDALRISRHAHDTAH